MEHEFSTVKLLLANGFDVELVPAVQVKGMHTPDIVMLGVPWEMKSPQGNGKRTIMNTIQNATHQSGNIIVDLRRCKLDENQALKEIRHHFLLSKRIRRMKIILKSEKLIDFNK